VFWRQLRPTGVKNAIFIIHLPKNQAIRNCEQQPAKTDFNVDLYQTLIDFAERFAGQKSIRIFSAVRVSLLSPMASTRDCKSAGIPIQFCFAIVRKKLPRAFQLLGWLLKDGFPHQ